MDHHLWKFVFRKIEFFQIFVMFGYLFIFMRYFLRLFNIKFNLCIQNYIVFPSIRDKYNHKWHNIDQYPTRKLENQYFTHFTNSTYLKIFNLLKYSQAWKVQIMKIRFSLFEESLEKNSKFLYILFLPLFLPYFAP